MIETVNTPPIGPKDRAQSYIGALRYQNLAARDKRIWPTRV
ncbi:MAG TPA: hypothetical protein VGO56_11670 [Pyrinomonadaceae bacterium]|nr:hypothetical protein [Pyrinomonadaceae bacterium]